MPSSSFLGYIDTHQHRRDWAESYKTTILEVSNLSSSIGVRAAIEMPNTKPRIISKELVEKRNASAKEQGCEKGHYLNIGGTISPYQIKEAVEAVAEYSNVTGIKIFTTGPDEDPLVIKRQNDQSDFYKSLTKFGYYGVVIPHCEKESMFDIGRFDPNRPYTWNDQRPKESEVAAIEDQIISAIDAGFQGHIHFPHVTCEESIDMVMNYVDNVSMSVEVTPQHMLFSTRDMMSKHGLEKKINPPIRNQETVDVLWEKLKDVVEKKQLLVTVGTDHAVHTQKEKMEGDVLPSGKIEGYLSGYPGLKLYTNLVQELERREFSAEDIESMTYWNAKKIFPNIKE
ncbi:MAG: hypothetical protein V1678_02055 [Candidatus Aenigmatarchaeota archaeon]